MHESACRHLPLAQYDKRLSKSSAKSAGLCRRDYSRSSQRAYSRFGRREGSLCSPYGVFEAAKLPQKRIKFFFRLHRKLCEAFSTDSNNRSEKLRTVIFSPSPDPRCVMRNSVQQGRSRTCQHQSPTAVCKHVCVNASPLTDAEAPERVAHRLAKLLVGQSGFVKNHPHKII